MRVKRFFVLTTVLIVGLPFFVSYAENKRPSHSMSEASVQNALWLYTFGIKAAQIQTSGPTHIEINGNLTIFHFNSYSDPHYPGIMMSGTITVNATTNTENGTLIFTGCDVTTIILNNFVTEPSPSGQLIIHFTDNTRLVYDYSTNVVSQ
jgi:hypothetical protein